MEYEDIINLKRPTSKYPKASITNRSAQFAPFSALNGYSDALEEVRRETIEKKDLAENRQDILDEKINILKDNLKNKPVVQISYYVKDLKKTGGNYKQTKGIIKKIDEVYGIIKLQEGKEIKIKDIDEILSDIFNNYNF